MSNYDLKFPHEVFDIEKYKRSEYSNCIILIDEGYVYLDSRTATSKQNRLTSYVLFQSRKKDVDIYISVQLIGTIDIRYRQMIDILIGCVRHVNCFEYSYYNLITNQESVKILPFSYAEQYYKYYNTYEIIQDDKMIKDIQPQAEKNQIIKDYAKLIIKKHKKKSKISRNEVALFVFNNDLDKSLIPVILGQIEQLSD